MISLAPLPEVPTNDEEIHSSSKTTWRNWLRAIFITKKSDLRILLSVLGCPLFPLSFNPRIPLLKFRHQLNTLLNTSEQQVDAKRYNGYVSGKVSMSIADTSSPTSTKGFFVLWQMLPNKWLIESVVAAHKVVASCDGNVDWRHTPWLGSHAAKGAIRPLRQALQGLDPLAIAAVFSATEYIGEKKILGIDSFVLKLSANHPDLTKRSDNTTEMIKHVAWLLQPKKSIASLFRRLILNQNSVSQFSSNVLGNNDGYKSVGLSACGGCYDCTFRFKRDYHKILRQLKGRACNHQNGRDIYHR